MRMTKYNHKKIEEKWQEIWAKTKLYQVDLEKSKAPFYNLMMFPYPSGEYLHIGHGYSYSGADVYGRFIRLTGKDVFEPIGYDSFGLPAENYAIKAGVHPKVSIAKNIEIAREQLKSFGCMFDFEKEVITSDPSYYKWTQWVFLKLFDQGLAYQKESPVNWCPKCKTVLANEQVISGKCERCDSEVIQKKLKQWFFKTTKYANSLINDLDKVDWPESSKIKQKNWIGKSTGVEFEMEIDSSVEKFGVFTTRIDTVFGMTYVVIAPEHPLVEKITTKEYEKEVKSYQKTTQKLAEIERQSTEKEKTGVFTGAYAINPFNKRKIPIWVADYVISSYGTGAVMAVPAHDERDFEFAKKFGLEIVTSVVPKVAKKGIKVFVEKGVLVESGHFTGLTSNEAIKKMAGWLREKGIGDEKTTYRLRDWSFSRQRYWGAPIPIVYCDKCGTVPIPEKDLPVELPEVKEFRPTGLGEGPLATAIDFVNTKCPKCGNPAKRETDTMDTFVDSSFYFMRYLNARDDNEMMNKNITQKWLPIDMYIGGAEHVTMHLLYARFVTKAFFDAGLLNFNEPFMKLRHQGMILGPDGKKMSKSKGNIVVPGEVMKEVGADAFRTYILFMGQFEDGGPWNPSGLSGIVRFLEKVWRLFDGAIDENNPEIDIERLLNKTIRKVGQDIEDFKFNTAISALMILANSLSDRKTQNKKSLEILTILISPFVPHLAEELWEKLGNTESVFDGIWPIFDKSLIEDTIITIAVQINGKVRDQILATPGLGQEEILKLAKESDRTKKYLADTETTKIIYIQDKLLSLVLK